MGLIYSTNAAEISKDSKYFRIAEINQELENLPTIDYSLKYLSDMDDKWCKVEWENEYGRYWESFDNMPELIEAVEENEKHNSEFEKQIDLIAELDRLNMKIADEFYYSNQYND